MLALILYGELCVEDIQASWRVESRRVLDLEVRMVQRLCPVKGRRDGRDRFRNLLKLGEERILSIANLVNCVARRALSLRRSLRILAEILGDHDLCHVQIVTLDRLINAPRTHRRSVNTTSNASFVSIDESKCLKQTNLLHIKNDFCLGILACLNITRYQAETSVCCRLDRVKELTIKQITGLLFSSLCFTSHVGSQAIATPKEKRRDAPTTNSIVRHF